MNESMNLISILTDIGRGMIDYVTVFIPRAFTAIVLLLIGWIIAKVLQKTLSGILSRVKFDELLGKVGISDAFTRVGIKDNASALIPRLIYFLVMIFFVRIAAETIGLPEVALAIDAALGYFPAVVSALIVVLFGNVLAQFAGRAVAASADGAGIEYAQTLGRLVSSMILFLIFVLAIAQLRINMEIINAVVLIVFGGLALGFAVSFGMGTRGITRNFIAGFYARKIFEVGDTVEVAGTRGTIEAITPLVTLMKHSEGTVAISNSAFVEEIRVSREA